MRILEKIFDSRRRKIEKCITKSIRKVTEKCTTTRSKCQYGSDSLDLPSIHGRSRIFYFYNAVKEHIQLNKISCGKHANSEAFSAI